MTGMTLGTPPRQRQHDDADGVLELGVGVEAVEHHLGVGVPFQLDDDAHAVPVALVAQIGDLLDPLFLDEVGDRLDQPRLVDHVGDLGDDDPLAAVGHLLDLAAGAQGDLAAPGGVGRADARPPHDDAAGREVRPLDVLHDLLEGGVGVVDQHAGGVDHLAEVVGRDVRRHAHRDARRPVAEQVGEAGGQHDRLLEAVVVVGHEIDGVLLDVG